MGSLGQVAAAKCGSDIITTRSILRRWNVFDMYNGPL